MRVNSIYIMLEDGRCIFNQYFTPRAPPKNLITGMFTALQSFVVEVTGNYPTVLSTEGFTFYFQKRGPITIVLSVTDTIKQPPELSEIGLKFLQNYGNEVAQWKGQDNHFDGFQENVVEVLGVKETTQRIDPKKPLTPLTLLHLEAEFQEIAKELIKQKEATSAELAKELDSDEYPLRLDLEKLVEQGYIGRYFHQQKYHYFTS